MFQQAFAVILLRYWADTTLSPTGKTLNCFLPENTHLLYKEKYQCTEIASSLIRLDSTKQKNMFQFVDSGKATEPKPVQMETRNLFHKTFFFVIYGHFAVNYRIFFNLWANLRSKFGHNYKSVIYRSVKFYGIGPSCTVVLLLTNWVSFLPWLSPDPTTPIPTS